MNPVAAASRVQGRNRPSGAFPDAARDRGDPCRSRSHDMARTPRLHLVAAHLVSDYLLNDWGYCKYEGKRLHAGRLNASTLSPAPSQCRAQLSISSRGAQRGPARMAEFASAVMALSCSCSSRLLLGADHLWIWKWYQPLFSRHQMFAGAHEPPQRAGQNHPSRPRANFTLTDHSDRTQ